MSSPPTMNIDAPIAGEPVSGKKPPNQQAFPTATTKKSPSSKPSASKRKTALTIVQTLMLILALSLSTYSYASLDSIDMEAGTDGNNASELLVRTEGRSADSICTEGGAEIFLGNDFNENGYLDDDEVTSSTKVCHGKEGLSGPQGAPGSTGGITNGLIETEVLNAESIYCSQSGIMIHSGTDINSNGQLEEIERQTSVPVCDGLIGSNGNDGSMGTNGADGTAGAPALVEQSSPPTSVCSSGFVLDFGIDDGRMNGIAFDGILHADEIRTSLKICNSPLEYGPISDFANGAANGITTNCDALVWMEQQQKILMAGVNGIDGCELWVSSGTESSTHLLLDIQPTGDSLPGQYLGMQSVQTLDGERVFFDADDGIHGRELWVSDGSEEGTHRVVHSGQSVALSSTAQAVHWMDGIVVVDASGALYWCDATTVYPMFEHSMFTVEQQQSLVVHTEEMSNLGQELLHANDTRLWFSAEINTDVEPYMLTSAGQFTSWNLNEQGASNPRAPLVIEGGLVVVGEAQFGRQLVHLLDDGNSNWLTTLQNQGTGHPTTNVAEHLGIHFVDGTLVFDALTSGVDPQLWGHELATGTTQVLSSIVAAPGDWAGGILHEDRLWFDCVAPQVAHEICSSDGTVSGTRVETDLRPGLASSNILSFASDGDTLFFLASGKIDGVETGSTLWQSSDGEISLAYDPWTGQNNNSASGTYGGLRMTEHHLIFAAHDGVRGHEIHVWSHGQVTDDWLIW